MTPSITILWCLSIGLILHNSSSAVVSFVGATIPTRRVGNSAPPPTDMLYQPRTTLTVESHPARKIFGSLSVSDGSPWCDGMPAVWLVGHQDYDETPWCLKTKSSSMSSSNTDASSLRHHNTYGFVDYSSATFVRPRTVQLDTYDFMNGPEEKIDRHSCTPIDVNRDGLLDVICAVGADKGEGSGYTELYLTTSTATMPTESDDWNRSSTFAFRTGLKKIISGHGLQKYPTTRSRLVKELRGGADGTTQLLFVATRGEPRRDNRTNTHRMYRNVNATTDVHSSTATSTPTDRSFFFEETPGPWDRLQTHANCLVVADLNGDGMDDILICNQRHTALIYIQSSSNNNTGAEEFTPLSMPPHLKWRQARAVDVTGDGIVDLVVVGLGRSEYAPKSSSSFVRIYKGLRSYPHFEFATPYFERSMPYGTPDLEVLDVNGDGKADIYIVQSDETTPGSYCAGPFDSRQWWTKGNQPPVTFVPPVDVAPDLLLVGSSNNGSVYEEVFMWHSEPGCGFFTELFGNNRTMILGQGTNSRPGHSLLLQW